MTTTAPPRMVSLDLQQSEGTRAVIEAIERDNAEINVSHFPGLVRLTSPHELVINRETVEAILGRPWETQEFQLAIVTYSGNISEWDDDQIIIKWQERRRPR
jgi:phenol/toluene 2-monooxygenase (NADH) P2/A2